MELVINVCGDNNRLIDSHIECSNRGYDHLIECKYPTDCRGSTKDFETSLV